MKKFRRIVVKAITYLMGIIFILACCAMDSEALWIPMTALAVSGTWLALVGWANGAFNIKESEE